jgi:hypothetical protein
MEMSDNERPLRGKQLAEIYTNPVDGHNCMNHKPKYGQNKFTCPCGKYYELADCAPGDYWEEKTAKTTEFVPYRNLSYYEGLAETKTQVDSWLEVGKLVLKNFQMHERTQYVEFIFLCIGIVYFLEAIVKNTLEMLR